MIAARGVRRPAGPAGLIRRAAASSREVYGRRLPGESAEYRAARNRLLGQEIEFAVRWRRWLRPGGGCRPAGRARGLRLSGARAGRRAARVRLSELFAPGKNSLVIYSMMFPRAADDTSPGPPGGPTALLPLAEARARRAPPCSISWTARPSTSPSTSTSPSPRRRRSTASSPSPPSAAGGGCAAVLGQHDLQPRLPRRDRRRRPAADAERVFRDGQMIGPLLGLGAVLRTRRSGGKNPATSAPSSRCGTCSTSPGRAAQPVGMSSSATDHPGGGKDADHPGVSGPDSTGSQAHACSL